MQTLLRTPLYDRHVAAGARLVPFAGWEMPVQYEGVIPEHLAVRRDCGIFDVSHMGEFEVEGPRATQLLQATLSNALERIDVGQAQYTLLTNESGGIVDDLIAYRLEPFRYLLIVNAANRHVDFDWLISLYRSTLGWVLRHQRTTLLVTLATAMLTFALAWVIPKGLFPLQDTGLIQGVTRAEPDASFARMAELH